ncbi:MAG: nuclear transport factor 2 family protein [Chloroflexi bacterium]|nr:nuclear transport factor 2 family protein [Chloroflexota bacterium]
MNQVSDKIRAFFEEFERANNAFDPDLLASLVGDPLVGADPNGVVQAISKKDYLAGTAKSQQYLQSLGFQFVKVVPVEEISLSEHYMMVKTKGTMRLEKIKGQPIDLVHDATYILFIKDSKPQIVFALSHEDPMKMAQEQHGVVY